MTMKPSMSPGMLAASLAAALPKVQRIIDVESAFEAPAGCSPEGCGTCLRPCEKAAPADNWHNHLDELEGGES